MASGGGEQSSREGCEEELRRQTSGPPTLDATLRSMNSRSTVAWPADRDVVNECIDTPPTSPVQKGRDAVELEHNRRRATQLATSGAQRGAFPPAFHPRPGVFQSTCDVNGTGHNFERYSEFDFNLSTQPAPASVQHSGSRPGLLMYRETSCPPFVNKTSEGSKVLTERDGPCFGQNVSGMADKQQQPPQLVAADSLNQMRQYKVQLEQEIQYISAELEKSSHMSNQHGEGQSIMPPLMIGHQPLRYEHFQHRTDIPRRHGDHQGNSQSAGRPETGRGNNYRHEDRTVVGFHPQPQLRRRNPNDTDSNFSSNASASESDSETTDHRHFRHRHHGNRMQSHQRRQSRNKHNWMKPEKFNGHGSFETFLIHFENCASYNRWSDTDKLAHLRWSLTGAAAQLLWGAEHCTYNELLELLRSRFSGRGMEEKFQSELRFRRRNKGESLRELAQDIRRLMTLAYPGEKSTLSEHIARDAFLSALADSEFELKIREREPTSLDDAVKIAQRFEMFKHAADSSSARHRFNRHVRQSSVSDQHSSDLEVRVAALEDRSPILPTREHRAQKSNGRESLADSLDSSRSGSLQEGHNATGRLSASEDQKQFAEEQVKKLISENEMLHKELDRLRYLDALRYSAPRQPTTPVIPATLPESRQGRSCFTCGRTGHFSRYCPQKPRYGRCFQRERREVIDQRPARANRLTRRQQRTVSGATYLPISIRGRSYDCLLDTGSDVTVIPASIAEGLQMKESSRVLTAANGTEIAVLGEVTLPFVLRNYKSTMTGLVTEHVSEIMLGIDWLVENQATWEFDKSRIKLGGAYHNLRRRNQPNPCCRRVVLQEDVTIPARSEVDLPTKVILSRLSGEQLIEGVEWGTGAGSLGPGLHVSRAIIPSNRLTDIPVRVMNVRTEPISIKSGASVSDLHPATIVGPVQDNVSIPGHQVVEDRQQEVPQFLRSLVDGAHESLDDDTRAALSDVLTEYADTFSSSAMDLGCTGVVEHHIDTGDSRPVRQPLRRHPAPHVEVISRQVDDMLAQGVIERACSPWASNLVLVKKKDGSFRCCVDYRTLNSVTRKDAYPLPRIDACLDAMATASWFSVFDLQSAYHQVLVNPADSDKTAFICPRGMFKFRKMPFGLCNAGATFQRLMDIIMSGLCFQVCLVYLDDIIVFSQTPEQHLVRLRIVLERLRSAGLKLKPEKCTLFQKSVAFLGHVVSGRGIETDPVKTQAVKEWPIPKSIREVRAFLGLAGYYRRFVRDFAAIAAPLHALMGKGKTFKWDSATQQAFDKLKEALTSPPILAMPTDEGDYILDTDASDTAIGAVLSVRQDGIERVIAYASRRLDRREVNYCVSRKELLSVVHFMRYFRQYLLGRHQFKVRTDHAALTWLRRLREPIGQQARWLEVMEEFDFVIEHRPGTKHGNADALSRRPCGKRNCACRNPPNATGDEQFGVQAGQEVDADENILTRVVASREVNSGDEEQGEPGAFIGEAADQLDTSVSAVELQSQRESPEEQRGSSEVSAVDAEVQTPWSLAGLQAGQRNDPHIGFIIRQFENNECQPAWDIVALESDTVKALWAQWPRLSIRDGLLKRRFETPDGSSVHWQVVWPESLRKELLEVAHSGMTGGHFGRRRLALAVQSRAYWPSWSTDVERFVKQCEPCARYHRGVIPRRGGLCPSIVGEPWERVSIDITGPHPKSSRQHQFILTCVDHFSKWAEAIPLRNHTASSVARALMTHVFSRFGAPRQLLSDCAPEFESELFQNLMRWMGIDKLRTSAYQPSTNGAVERFHRTLNTMLGKVVSQSQRDWDELLPALMAAYRASPHDATGFSPNRLFLGREVNTPLDVIMGLPPQQCEAQSMDEFVQLTQQRMSEAFTVAREHLRVSAERRKTSYDRRVRPSDLKIGDWVWYWYPRRFTARSYKWQRNYTGPYLVVRAVPPVNFAIQKSPKSKPFIVHVNKLKKCLGDTPVSWLDNDSCPGDSLQQTQFSEAPILPNTFQAAADNVRGRSFPSRARHPPRRFADYVC